MRLIVLPMIALFAFSSPALADEPPQPNPANYTKGSVKIGAEAASNSIGGNSAGTSAAVSFRTAQVGASSGDYFNGDKIYKVFFQLIGWKRMGSTT